jgi:hypothetical protein
MKKGASSDGFSLGGGPALALAGAAPTPAAELCKLRG